MHGGIFGTLATRLETQEPKVREKKRAAVSVMLSDTIAPKVLLIKRSEREGDPWSGQIAFPGGKFQDGDESLRATAVREALEEVGVDLGASSDFLGYLGLFRTHTADMEVVPAVFLLRGRVSVKTNEEAASYKWVDLGRLQSEGAMFTYRIQQGGEPRDVPSLKVDDYVVWGLTRQIILYLIGKASA